MLSTGSTPEMREMEEHIGAYCNLLLGLLLFCQGITVGAGPTLLACIRSSAEKVINHSLSLMQGAVSSYGYFHLSFKIEQKFFYDLLTILDLRTWFLGFLFYKFLRDFVGQSYVLSSVGFLFSRGEGCFLIKFCWSKVIF